VCRTFILLWLAADIHHTTTIVCHSFFVYYKWCCFQSILFAPGSLHLLLMIQRTKFNSVKLICAWVYSFHLGAHWKDLFISLASCSCIDLLSFAWFSSKWQSISLKVTLQFLWLYVCKLTCALFIHLSTCIWIESILAISCDNFCDVFWAYNIGCTFDTNFKHCNFELQPNIVHALLNTIMVDHPFGSCVIESNSLAKLGGIQAQAQWARSMN